ncbi:unnamed protein product [Moneuplotes crassus]|uniref:Uncharacterized protein n=1 Tax=Euplotes crassus TaxID=5936 RepID=A0AAD1Y6T2_EUPCR|nr:unnamed protein product [Moneuplotes crassus]
MNGAKGIKGDKNDHVVIHSYLTNIHAYCERKKKKKAECTKSHDQGFQSLEMDKNQNFRSTKNITGQFKEESLRSSIESLPTTQNDKISKQKLKYNIYELYSKKRKKSNKNKKMIFKSSKLVDTDAASTLYTQDTKRWKIGVEQPENRLSFMKRMQNNKTTKTNKEKSCVIQKSNKKNLKESSIRILKANSIDKREKKNTCKSLQMTDVKRKTLHKSVMPKVRTGLPPDEKDSSQKRSLMDHFERVKPSKVFSETSPNASITSVPKEFLTDTSGMEETEKRGLCKRFHTKSQYSAPTGQGYKSPTRKQSNINQYEIPVATYDEDYSFQNSRQAGNYKCSLWKIQQTKINNNIKKITQNREQEETNLSSHSLANPLMKRPQMGAYKSNRKETILRLDRRSTEATPSDRAKGSAFSSRNNTKILPDGYSLPREDSQHDQKSVEKDNRRNKLLYSNKNDDDYYCPQIKNNFQVKKDTADFFLLNSTPSEEKKLTISGISSRKNDNAVAPSAIYRVPARKKEYLPWKGNTKEGRFQPMSPHYAYKKLNGVPQYEYLVRAERVRERSCNSSKIKSHCI